VQAALGVREDALGVQAFADVRRCSFCPSEFQCLIRLDDYLEVFASLFSSMRC
jgi:hypothetical protein